MVFYVSPNKTLEGRIYTKPPLLLIPTASSGDSQTTLKLRNSLEGFIELGEEYYICGVAAGEDRN